MKKLLLTALASLTILFTQAQCQADFSYMQNGPTTIFTDLSFVNQGWSTNYSVTWEWDFGDGTISTQQNPVHTYTNNGIYTPCLTVVYFDSVIINTCVSFYCDSILIGNSIPASWDCNSTTGCYDPGTGLGQYTSLSACQAVCGTPTPSWDCPTNTPGGCYDPGTGNGQYTSLSACQLACGAPCPGLASIAQNTNIFTANITGGIAPYTYLWSTGETTQAISVSLSTSGYCDITDANGCVYSANYSYSAGQLVACDSITVSGSQTQLTMQVNNFNSVIYYWISTAPDGTVLGEDSMWNSHLVFNSFAIPNDTITTCITYANGANTLTCCVEFFWNGSFWAKMGSVTSIGEIDLFDKKLIKVVDVLGRETKQNKQPLFYIYDDGTVEKRIVIE